MNGAVWRAHSATRECTRRVMNLAWRPDVTRDRTRSSRAKLAKSLDCRAASPSAATVSSACTSGEASPYAPKASPRVWPNERSRSRMGSGARRAVLPVRRARRREVFPCAHVGSLRHGAALLVARPRALIESVAAEDGLNVEEPPLHRQPRARRRVARGGRRCHCDVDGRVWHRAGRRPWLQQHLRRVSK